MSMRSSLASAGKAPSGHGETAGFGRPAPPRFSASRVLRAGGLVPATAVSAVALLAGSIGGAAAQSLFDCPAVPTGSGASGSCTIPADATSTGTDVITNDLTGDSSDAVVSYTLTIDQSASLTFDVTNQPRGVRVALNGADGTSDAITAGWGGDTTIANNAPTITATASSGDPTDTSGDAIQVLRGDSAGGDGGTPGGDNGSGGRGGNGGTVTVTNDGDLVVTGNAATVLGYAPAVVGIAARSYGGDGGEQNEGVGDQVGGNGGDTGKITVENAGSITIGEGGAFAGAGYAWGIAATGLAGDAGFDAAEGGTGSIVDVTSSAPITIDWDGQDDASSGVRGIYAASIGGDGSQSENKSDSGGRGEPGQAITVTVTDDITVDTTAGETVTGDADSPSALIFAISQGGDGGEGPDNADDDATGGEGGGAATAGVLQVTVNGATLAARGDDVLGVVARSLGGDGGDGDPENDGKDGGDGGFGGQIQIDIGEGATITTTGANGYAVIGQSVGGLGGEGGNDGGDAGNGADAGGVGLYSADGTIATQGDFAAGITLHSVGGGGGTGGNFTGVLAGSGGNGGNGGDGGTAVITAAIDVTTAGDHAHGLLVQSIGGSGGTGGIGTGLVLGLGGDGGAGGRAGTAEVNNTGALSTSGYGAAGIVAQSISGGGGAAGVSGGVLSIGGQSGSANAGDLAYVTNNADVATAGDAAPGIQVQSIGGGGGSAAGSAGIFTVGGEGSAGGGGGTAQIYHVGGTVSTTGAFSYGLHAQSIGGGGGSGGDVLDLSAGVGVGVGGEASGGGDGGAVCVTNTYDNVCASGIGDTGSEAPAGTSSTVTTTGDFAVGILAQSIGGGGGTGGSATSAGLADVVSVTVGGGAGGGGHAGQIQVDFTDLALATSGDNAPGLVAQAVGGGGGNGGNTTSAIAGGILPLQIGGAAGTGGNGFTTDSGGDIVPLTVKLASSAVTTAGSHSFGIVAQAIGGGGGNGGSASGYDASVGFDFDTSVGGTGGTGGTGGQPTVTLSDATVVTSGTVASDGTFTPDPSAVDAHGLVLQSIGGGGGNGGQSVADALTVAVPTGEDVSVDASVTTSVGGAGGTAGGGSIVDATLSGATSVTTGGDGAMGILAQSIGGGGGNGGSADALSATVGDVDSVSVGVTSAIGASAGSGASGGLVTVTLQDQTTVTTAGDHANAILAQSVGGGGGNGGVGSVANDRIGGGLDVQATIGLGGTGGSGGFANTVTVTAGEGTTVATTGSGARGIVAQSVAGGGGTSQGGTIGLSASESVAGEGEEEDGGDEGDDGTLSGAVTVSIGATGGGGERAGTVSLATDGHVSTAGDDADGVLAQSIGGSGGLGGSAGNDAGAETDDDDGFSGGDDDTAYTLTLAVGGTGGTGSDGGAITLTHAGHIVTAGDHADGLLAQSIGGGGGAGGTAVAEGSEATASVTLGVGGAGGTGGDGGEVTLTFDDDDGNAIDTSGYMAHAALVQSIGGGGGQGADGSEKSSGDLTVGGGFGGSGGATGDGGAITITASSWLNATTEGDDAYGVVLQSIGGGGGVGGAGTKESDGDDVNLAIQVGGRGGGAGSGGAIGMTDVGFAIATTGARSHGLVVQSIGGGGGIGVTGPASGTAQLGGGDGVTGAGGAVTVALTEAAGANKTSISTTGEGAHALIVQSIGGGGGIAGDVSGPIAADAIDDDSLGAGGSGSAVTVSVDAVIATSGAGAHGILAQSIGGGGGLVGGASGTLAGSLYPDADSDAGAVSVTQAARLTTSGEGSVGIFAQSAATDTDGTVTVTVNGAVTGGTGENGVGVWVSEGGDFDGPNTLTVNGSVTSGDSDADAIRYTSRFSATGGHTLAVENNGTIDGDIVLTNADGGSAGTVTNDGTIENDAGVDAVVLAATGAATGAPHARSAGAVLTGARRYDAHVVNAGRLEIGRAGAGDTTTITGDLAQIGTGTIAAAVDFARGRGDRLVVEGDADLAGAIALEATTLAPVEVAVLTVAGETTGALVALDTPAVDYALAEAGGAFTVVPDTRFAAASDALDRSERAVGHHLDAIFDAGGGDYGTFLAALDALSAAGDEAGYAAALSALAPGASNAVAAAQPTLARERLDRTMSCPAFAAGGARLFESACVWADGGARRIDQDAERGATGYDGTLWRLAGGGQFAIRDDWYAGVSVGYEDGRLDGSGGATRSEGAAGSLAVSLKYDDGAVQLAAALAASYGSYDVTRRVRVPGFAGTAEGTSDVSSVGGRIRAAYTLAGETAYLRPFVDLDVVHTVAGGYTETGAGLFDLRVAETSQTVASATPAVELGARARLGEGWRLRAFARAGVTVSSGDSFETVSRLAAAPAAAGTFETAMPMPDVLGRLGAGLQVSHASGFDLRAEYDGSLGDGFGVHGGMLRLIRRF